MFNKKKDMEKSNDFSPDQMKRLREMENRTTKLARRFWAGIFAVFIILTAAILSITMVYHEQFAAALSGNYVKSTGDTLTAAEWNNLTADFVSKSGDAMTGNLTVPDVCLTGGSPCLSSIPQPPSLNCPGTPDFSSTPAGRGPSGVNYYMAFTPTAAQFNLCLETVNPGGCVIKRDITNATGVISSGTWEYVQYATNNWVSEYVPSNTDVNGNTVIKNIIQAYGSSIKLVDDYWGTYDVERNSNSWAVRDSSTTLGVNIYICTWN